LIATISFRKYYWEFTRSDWAWIFVGVALFVFYFLTKSATLSALLATLADLAGYVPTVKKAWRFPNTDNPVGFAFNSVKCIPALLALSSYSLATCVYLVMLLVANGGMVAMLIARREYLRNAS
jgi:hypothetical protein